MRYHLRVALVTALAALLIVAIIIGCSDDDDSGTNNPTPTTYSLTVGISPDTAGTVAASPSQNSYVANDTVTLTATPDTYFAFDHWEYFGVDTTDNPFTIVFDSTRDEEVTAVFEDVSYTLTVTIDPVASGTVTLDPDQELYAEGDTTVLTPVAADGYVFDHWVYDSQDFYGNPVILTFEGDTHDEAITAVFVDESQVVTISGFAFRSDADLVNPVFVLMDEDFAILDYDILEGGNDTAYFFFQFLPATIPASYIHVVDDLDGDYTIFEDGEPYQCYDSDDANDSCDFITYTAGMVIDDVELELFVDEGASSYSPTRLEPARIEE